MSERKWDLEYVCRFGKTEFGNVFEYFCGIEVGLRIFLSEEKREEKLELEKFCPKKQKGERD